MVSLGLLAFNAFASFTGSVSDTHSVTSGTMTLEFGAVNRLGVSADDIAPGDTIQRAVDLTMDTSTVAMQANSLTVAVTAPTVSSALNTDATNGLQLTITKCSQAWTESGPPYTYTCGGSTSAVLAETPVANLGSATALSNLTATTPGNTDHLRIYLRFPSGANDTFQGLSSDLVLTFAGTQRAGTDK
jgi:hypothetical protein